MPLTGLMSIADMVTEINRRVGNYFGALTGTTAPIERAINDAYLQAVLKYRHAEFEAAQPFFFESEALELISGTNTAGSRQITTTNAGVATYDQRLLDCVMQFPGAGISFRVYRVQLNTPGPGTHTISVAPEIPTANTNAPFSIFINRYPLPVDPVSGKTAFIIYDLADNTNNIPVRSVDFRLFDRSVPIVGQAIYYDRINNNIMFHPAPYQGVGKKIVFKLRYALRPEYKSGTATLAPLPEEWQEVIMLEAQAKIYDATGAEHERASSLKQEATRLATELMKPEIEEIDDVEAALIPVRSRW